MVKLLFWLLGTLKTHRFVKFFAKLKKILTRANEAANVVFAGNRRAALTVQLFFSQIGVQGRGLSGTSRQFWISNPKTPITRTTCTQIFNHIFVTIITRLSKFN